VLNELVQFDLPAAVDVAFCEQLVNNSLSVLVVDALLREECVELLLGHLARTICIDLREFIPQLIQLLC
jgi:hypothetical protein